MMERKKSVGKPVEVEPKIVRRANKTASVPVQQEDPIIVKPPAPKEQSISLKATAKRTVYYIANPTASDVALPRPGLGGLKATCIVFPAGQSIEVDAAEWNELRQRSGVRNYIDHGILAEVNRGGSVLIVRDTISDLIIPEHLKHDNEIAAQATPVSAKVRQKNVVQFNVG
jgi:hypothetical protein